jgi:hypothetical protein
MIADDEPPVTLAEVPATAGARLHVSWGLGDELFVTGLQPAGAAASSVRWGCPSAAMRRVAYDAVGKYAELKRGSGACGGAAAGGPAEWAAARGYAAAMTAILAADSPQGAAPAPEEAPVFQERALWDLLALLFLALDDGPDALPAADLARWLAGNEAALGAALPAPLAAELVQAALPEAHARYWPAFARLAAGGRAAEAVELLGLHSAWLSEGDAAGDVEALDAALLLLKRFPVLGEGGGIGCGADDTGAAAAAVGRELSSLEEWAAYRRAWRAQVQQLAADAGLWARCEPATAAGLRRAVEVLAGDDDALRATAAGWPDLFAARALLAHPEARGRAELRQVLARCLADAPPPPGDAFLLALARAADAALDLDAQSALAAASTFASDWFMAHVPELLAAHPAGAALLGCELPHLGGAQAEFYALEYAAALVPGAATWPLALEYAAWCPEHGCAAFEAALARLPLDAADAAHALRLAAAAEERGAPALARLVLQQQGALCWEAGAPGAALAWFSRAGDAARADAALAPLAELAATPDVAAALDALAPALEAAPPGAAVPALLEVRRLLEGGGARLGEAVAAMRRLPPALRARCLGAACAAAPTADATALAEGDVAELVAWVEDAQLEGGEGALAEGDAAVVRLALVRLLAATHMRAGLAVAAA